MDSYKTEIIKRRRIISIVFIWVFILLLVILAISLGLIYGLNSNASNSFSRIFMSSSNNSSSLIISSSSNNSSSMDPSSSSIVASSSSCVTSGSFPVTFVTSVVPSLFCSTSNQFPVTVNYTLNTCTNQVNLSFPMSTILCGSGCGIATSFFSAYAVPSFLLPTTLQTISMLVINCSADQSGSTTIDPSGTITVTTSILLDPTDGSCYMGYETFTASYTTT
jgi:hypothetical protein